MMGSVATTHFDMQKLFLPQKEKHLHREQGLDFLKQIVNHVNHFVISFYFKIQKIISINSFFPKLRLVMNVAIN